MLPRNSEQVRKKNTILKNFGSMPFPRGGVRYANLGLIYAYTYIFTYMHMIPPFWTSSLLAIVRTSS